MGHRGTTRERERKSDEPRRSKRHHHRSHHHEEDERRGEGSKRKHLPDEEPVRRSSRQKVSDKSKKTREAVEEGKFDNKYHRALTLSCVCL